MADVNVNVQQELADLYDVPETTVDDFGQPSQTPSLILAGLWVKVDSIQRKYREAVNIRQQWPTATHIITHAWLGSTIPSTTRNPYRQITPDMTYVCQMDGRVLNVLMAVNVERRNTSWYVICAEHFGAAL